MEQFESVAKAGLPQTVIEINLTVISAEALLKTCHWFSRDFAFEIRTRSEHIADVFLTPRSTASASDLALAREAFNSSAMDFALREKIEAKTSGIRDLILAKAFSEFCVLEDQPEGVFCDKVVEVEA